MTHFKFTIYLKNEVLVNIYDHKQEKNINKFYQPLTSKLYKIYILSNTEGILYVGQAKQSIRNRLRYGLSASGSNGYHGYKWKDLPELSMNVFVFDDYNRKKIEAVEAEVVYGIRQHTGKWPLRQNEIHFNNEYQDAQNVAFEILEQILATKTKI